MEQIFQTWLELKIFTQSNIKEMNYFWKNDPKNGNVSKYVPKQARKNKIKKIETKLKLNDLMKK